MGRVISDAKQQVVRAAQLGDVIVSKKKPTLTAVALFDIILNLALPTVSLTLNSANSHAVQNANAGASKTCPTPTAVATLDPGSNLAASITIFPAVPSIDTGGSFPTVHPPDHEKLLSTQGSFTELEAVPSFTVT